jgi:nicotinate phosphoribosyltransferase
MALLSRQVRKILDDASLEDTEVFASSSFDEYKIARTITEGAMIDAFGVGTKMGVSSDAPYFDMVYKLVQYMERPIMKLSTGKINLPGEKQVFRKTDAKGCFTEDVIGTRDETIDDARPLLEPVMRDGQLLRGHPSLEEIRERFRRNFESLDNAYKALKGAPSYPVKLSPKLKALHEILANQKLS